MLRRYDTIIVGGGIMGSAIAYFLAADPAYSGTILVVERAPDYAACATTRSWGGVRQQFSTAENIHMSLFGAQFVQTAGALLSVDGQVPDWNFRPQGYLFLASPAGLSVLRENCARQRALGAATELLDVPALAARFPWLHTADLGGGGFGPINEGWLDPHALLQALRRKAQSLGVIYVADDVMAIQHTATRVHGVRLRSGGDWACERLVNAAGPAAGVVAALAGIALPVRPRKRMTFVFACRTDLSHAPLTIAPNGVAFRPEGRYYLAIVSPPAEQDPDSSDLEPEYGLFADLIWPTLAERVPAFAAIKLVSTWAGHYDYNTLDQNAIIGPHPELDNFLFCNGFSGHGLQQAPAAGRALAEWIVHGRFVTIDLTRFGYARIAAGQPLREVNVV